jgi:hypothetical protein
MGLFGKLVETRFFLSYYNYMTMTYDGGNTMTTTTVFEFEDRIVTSMLPPRQDESCAPALEIQPGYWELMSEEYERWAEAA